MLRVGSIIEIAEWDGPQLSVRRVRVQKLRPSDTYQRITGVNLKGKNPKDYRLPTEPIESVQDKPAGDIGWLFAPQGPSDE